MCPGGKFLLETVSVSLVLMSILSRQVITQAILLKAGEVTSPNLGYWVAPQSFDENICEQDEVCKVAAECSSGFKVNAFLKPCSTASNVDGVCCPTIKRNEPSSTYYSRRPETSLKHRSQDVYWNAIQGGQQEYNEKLRQEDRHRAAMTAKGKPEPLFHRMLRPAATGDRLHSQNPDEQADVYGCVFASRKFAERTNMTLEERQNDRFERVTRPGKKRYLSRVSCDPNAPYRTINGACNNAAQTSWGQAEFPFDRVLPPAYEDGVWTPRIHSVTGNLLPSTRDVSVALFPDLFQPDPRLNILFMQYGQFVGHDFSLSRDITLKNGQRVECCTPDSSQELTGEQRHFSCLPIPVSPDDPFYSKFGVRCLNFVRARLAGGSECKLGYAKQADLNTHFIDASVVYGSTDDVALALRTFQRGKLKDSFPNGSEMLKFTRNPKDCVPWARVCYEAGDIRSNHLLSLTMIHTLFLRLHNRFAEELSKFNPRWDDERLYQEARRIVIAMHQNVAFNEYLPILLGQQNVEKLGLVDPLRGYTNSYDPKLRPMTLAEVSVAAHRFGHSTVEGFFRILHKKSSPEDVFIKDLFNDPSKTQEPNSFDEMLLSFNRQPMEMMDSAITTGLTQFLFRGHKPFGSDLAATNMQRNRDFATRPYNDYRELAGLARITDFHQMGEAGARLARVYESPDDVDLWAGGLLEAPAEGALVGPTFSHLLTEAYSRFKFGDRYYFTNSPEVNPGAFTVLQLLAIRQASLASIICANVDNPFDFYQAPQAFLQPGQENVPVPCAEYPILRLEAWRD